MNRKKTAKPLMNELLKDTMPVPEDIAMACYDKLPQELREILDRWNSSVESIDNRDN